MPNTIIGIDPGKCGGIAWLDHDGPHAMKMPATERDLWLFVAELEGPETFAYIEHATGAIIGARGIKGIISLQTSYAVCRMAMIAAGIPFERVAPGQWQREFGLTRKNKTETDTAKKNRHKAKAQELLPQLKITHAIADALLIAEYGRRVLLTRTDNPA